MASSTHDTMAHETFYNKKPTVDANLQHFGLIKNVAMRNMIKKNFSEKNVS
jgi:hypothetical protein